MGSSTRLVRLIQIAMLASIAIFAVTGELVRGSPTPSSTLFLAFSLASISMLGTVFVVRRTLISQCEIALREKPNDAALLARWKAGYILLYGVCETLAILGLILRVTGFALAQVWFFYAIGFLLIIFFSPPPLPSQD